MIPFSPPRIDQAVIDEVTDTLKSGWITTGPKTKRFEIEINDYVGAKRTICLGSATAGLELMLRWFGAGPGDEVILPAYTYCATANVVMHCGATPVMVDTLPDNFNIDPEKIAEAITSKTKAIIPVDIAGWPCNYNAIIPLIENAKSLFKPNHPNQEKLGRILLLADSAHGFGARYHEKRLGSIADITVFSFHAVKNLTTAEGGAVCLNLPEGFDCDAIYKGLNTQSLHGQSKDALAKTQKGAWRYDVESPGYKCNMTDIQAAIGLVELSRYDSETIPKRKAICSLYSELLSHYAWADIPKFKDDCGCESSYHLYQLRIEGATEAQRDAIIQEVAEADIAVNVHFLPLPMLTAYKSQGYRIEDFPNAYDHYHNEISLPVFYALTEGQVAEVVNAIVKAVNTQGINA